MHHHASNRSESLMTLLNSWERFCGFMRILHRVFRLEAILTFGVPSVNEVKALLQDVAGSDGVSVNPSCPSGYVM